MLQVVHVLGERVDLGLEHVLGVLHLLPLRVALVLLLLEGVQLAADLLLGLPQAVDLVLSRPQLGVQVGVLVGELLLRLQALGMLLLQIILRALELVLLAPQALDLVLLVLDLLLEPGGLLVVPRRLLLLRVDLVLSRFHCLSELLEVLVEFLLALLLLLRLREQLLELVPQGLELAAPGGPLCLQLRDLAGQVGILLLQLDDLPLEHVAILDQVILFLHQLVDHVLLVDAQTGPLLHEPTQLRDLSLQVLDSLFGPLLLLVRGLDHFPCSLDLPLQRSDRLLVLLRQLQGSLHLDRILDNLGVQLAALLDQVLLTLVRLLERAVQLLVLLAEVLQGLVANELLQDLLEVPLQGLESGGLEVAIRLLPLVIHPSRPPP
mmetsp:Transcript_49604/g.142220  ORF Transcript_49604/g.142220 Transcript_49604/m.142220 type:complete len:378 (+) Transcript_49604:1523-2656(+)